MHACDCVCDIVVIIVTLRLVGPTRPHTINNPEWEAASRERLLGMRSNPIEGLSAQNKA